MKIAIVGSRGYEDREQVEKCVDDLVDQYGDELEVISGGASGPDTWAVNRAIERSVPVRVYPADWETHGHSAGVMRNTDIVKAAGEVIAFWDLRSAGTRDTIKKARAAGKKVTIHYPSDAGKKARSLQEHYAQLHDSLKEDKDGR